MNQKMLVVAMLSLVAAGSCDKSPGRPGKPTAAQKALCNRAFTPSTAAAALLKNATANCIAAQPGLQALITSLHGGSGESMEDEREDEIMDGFLRCDSNAASILESHGYAANATELRKCIATAMGLVKSDGTFDMITLKAAITTKVTGLSISANTQLGLTNCPVVVSFNVPKYLDCVKSYCLTGAPPKGR